MLLALKTHHTEFNNLLSSGLREEFGELEAPLYTWTHTYESVACSHAQDQMGYVESILWGIRPGARPEVIRRWKGVKLTSREMLAEFGFEPV